MTATTTTFLDLKNYVRDHEYSDDSDRGDRNLEIIINDAFREIYEAYDWPHLTKRNEIRTQAPFRTGTVTVTDDSATVAGNATAWTSNLIGGLMFITGNDTFYNVIAVAATNSMTIKPVFTDPTGDNLTAAQYEILFPIYAHPTDFLSMKQPVEGSFLWSLIRIEIDEWIDQMLINEGSSTPTVYAVDGDNIYLYPAPADQRVVHHFYYFTPLALKGDAQVIDWPEHIMWVLRRGIDKNIALEFRGRGSKEYAMAKAEFEAGLKRAVSAMNPSREGRVKQYEGVGRTVDVSYRVPIREIQDSN